MTHAQHVMPIRSGTNVTYALSQSRQCVLDVGNALKGGDMPHRHALMVSWRGMDDAPYEVERLSLHPVPCLPARVPMSRTHSRNRQCSLTLI